MNDASNDAADSGETASGEVGLTELSPTEWRVSDRSRGDGDPAALLGFIQLVGGAYEVTNLGRLRERTYFSSFERAAASLVEHNTREVMT